MSNRNITGINPYSFFFIYENIHTFKSLSVFLLFSSNGYMLNENIFSANKLYSTTPQHFECGRIDGKKNWTYRLSPRKSVLCVFNDCLFRMMIMLVSGALALNGNNHGTDKWFGGHRNGETGLNPPYTLDIVNYKNAVYWIRHQLASDKKVFIGRYEI